MESAPDVGLMTQTCRVPFVPLMHCPPTFRLVIGFGVPIPPVAPFSQWRSPSTSMLIESAPSETAELFAKQRLPATYSGALMATLFERVTSQVAPLPVESA